jgi:GH43 family beta-xylosidase
MSMLVFLAALGVDAAAEPPRYQNPIVRQRADPWVYRHTDGWYYFTASVPEYDRVEVRRSRTIQGLGSAPAVVVWRRHDTGIMSANIWAPEIHFIGHSWYIYFAAGETVAPFNHRIYVLQNDSPDPLGGLWVEKGQVRTGWESFSLDATEFEHGGAHYLVWAQKDYGIRGNSNLYIAAMNNPWIVAGSAVRISKPEFPWEKKGYWVNEGPAVLVKNGRVFITYSASATDASYCMGMLTAPGKSDLLDPASWTKSSLPVLQTDDAAGIYGPGHNCFTTDGDDDILVYHARAYRDITGEPLYDPNRDTRAETVIWGPDGTPVFEPAR